MKVTHVTTHVVARVTLQRFIGMLTVFKAEEIINYCGKSGAFDEMLL